MNKRFFITTLFLLLVSMFFTTVAFAEVDMSDEEVDQRLRDIGVPNELILEMDPVNKRDVAENATEFLGTESVYMTENLDQDDNNLITPFGKINPNMMSLSIDVYKSYSPNNRKRMLVYARFHWYQEPFWTLQDIIAFQWNSSRWRPVDGSFQSYISYGGTTVRESSTVMSDITDSGVYDHVNIRSFWGSQGGYLRGIIEAQRGGTASGSDQIFAKYVHNKIAGSIGASFKGFGSIGITGSNYDEMATFKTFNY